MIYHMKKGKAFVKMDGKSDSSSGEIHYFCCIY